MQEVSHLGQAVRIQIVTGLAVDASPDRGDGARMSWLQMADAPGGLQVNFYDYRDEHVTGGLVGDVNGCGANDNFFLTTVATGLDRTKVHSVKIAMDFLEGPRNDVVRVWVDAGLVYTDTSWEDYFRYCEGNQRRSVDSIPFRTAGMAAPSTLGHGFLIDNLSLSSGPTTTAASDGEWTLYPQQTSSTSTNTETLYQAKVRPPINADGSSNFPKRRGVLPVQFDLQTATRTTTSTTVGPVAFKSIGSDTDTSNDYSYLMFVPDTPMLFADLNNLTADYSFTTGNCAGGSLRWQVRLDVKMGLGITFGHSYPSLYVWAAITGLITLSPLAHLGLLRIGTRFSERFAEAVIAADVPAQRRIGLVLVRRGWLSLVQLEELLDAQATDDGPRLRIGEMAVARGYVTDEQITDALREAGAPDADSSPVLV